MGQFQTYPFDALRQVGLQLLVARGISADTAASFVDALLWYDAVAAGPNGIESLPNRLAAIDRAEINAQGTGDLAKEFAGTAVIDGKQGAAPLVLSKAARIAQEKARDVGVGVVMVTNVAGRGTPESACSDIAIGPYLGCIYGPGSAITIAVPSMGTVPAVFSSALGEADALVPPWSLQRLPAWTFPFAGEGDWLVVAYSVTAFESLETFHEQIDRQLHARARVAGEVRAEDWYATRNDQHENGLTISAATAKALADEAAAREIEFPQPI